MPRVVSLKANKRTRAVTITFDEGPALELHHDTAAEFSLHEGDELDETRLQEIVRRDGAVRCRAAAWRLLSIRPRSRRELETALRQRRFLRTDIEAVLTDLGERQFVDDSEFARQFVENRVRRRQGGRLIAQELRHKGVADADARPHLEGARDSDRDRETMRELLTRWNRRSKPEDPRKRAAAAAAFLARRGFDSQLVWEAVRAFFRQAELED